MEYFVNEYFSVEKFKKTYGRRVEHLGDRRFWPHFSIAHEVGAPLSKGPVGRQRKNRMKGCLEVDGSSKKPKSNEKEKKLSVVSSNALIIKSWAIEKITPSAPSSKLSSSTQHTISFDTTHSFIRHQHIESSGST
jgi:hypothetical protein